MDENLATASSQQSQASCDASSLNVRADVKNTSRDTLRALNPNICLTRLSIDHELTKTGSSVGKTGAGVGVSRVSTESPLRRKLLTRRALTASHQTTHVNDVVTTAAKAKRHGASKMSASCRCFGRPMVCSICLARFVLYTRDLLLVLCTVKTRKF